MTTNSPPDQQSAVQLKKQQLDFLIQQQRFEDARELCAGICKSHPDDTEFWFMLGAIHGQLGDFAEAETCCNTAIRLCPGHGPLHHNLGIAQLRQNKLGAAADSFLTALRLNPQHAEAMLELGNVRHLQNNDNAAIQCYQQAGALNPNNPLPFHHMAKAYHCLRQDSNASSAYEKAIALKPDFLEAYTEYTSLLLERYKYDRVISLLEQATGHLPLSTEILFRLGVAHQEQGDADLALEYYSKCLDIDPGHVDARTGIAGVLGLQGKYEEARELLEPVLAANPENASAVITFAHFAHKFQRGNEAKTLLSGKLEDSSLTSNIRSKLLFALGKLLDREQDYEHAFGTYREANKLKHMHFNREETQRMFAAIKSVYSSENMANLPRSSDIDHSPIFIVGMNRSGTSLVEQIIASHPDVFGAGELNEIKRLIVSLPDRIGVDQPYPWGMQNITAAVIEEMAQQYRMEVERRSGGTRCVTDKMPANFLNLGLINLMFPNARIIHCLRDPLDCCLSCYFHNFSGEHAYSYDLADLGFYYRLYNDLMSHWDTVLDVPMLSIRYEELVSNQESVSRKIVGFCDLAWDTSCLSFYKTRRTVATASFDQVRQPIYTSAVGRADHYRKYLGELGDALHQDTSN